LKSSPPASGAEEIPGFGEGPPGKGLTRFYDQRPEWVSCDDSGKTCADIWVPLDYGDPNGTAITIKAKMDPAGAADAQVGSLFINPGGPGGSGIDYLDQVKLGSAVTAVYDVIGFDPRGVATSTPVDCITDAELDALVAADPSPDTPQEIAAMEDLWANFTAGCRERSGPLLRHVSTVEVARDLDVMRSVVGDRQLFYFGGSYGTYIGATYAGLFPERVGRMVLDGAVDPLAKPQRSHIGQAVGFETALMEYLSFCVESGSCPLGDDVETARDAMIDLLHDLDSNPLPTASGRELTEGLGFLGVVLPLYSRTTWPYLTQGLEYAINGRGDVLLALADTYAERSSDGTYATNSLEVQSAVNCLDHPERASLAQIQASSARFSRLAPVFGPVATWFAYGCSNWPVSRSEPLPDFSAKGAAPIVVVGTTRDPATPYQQAVKLADVLESGVLLTRDGDGHGAYGAGNTCIDDAIDAYLADDVVPDDGTRC
jgi:pimeloyl-ACP methyl ester carboxylesterase